MQKILILFIFCYNIVLSQNNSHYIINDSLFGSQLKIISNKNQEIVLISMDSLKVCKLNTCGNILFYKKLNTPNYLGLNDIIQTKDGKYLFLSRQNNGNLDVSFVSYFDENFNEIWSKSIEDQILNHFPYTILEDSLGNFIIYGNGQNSTSNVNILLFIDKNGNCFNSKLYDLGRIWGAAIVTSDKGFLLRTGNRFIKTDSIGNILWISVINSPNYFYFKAQEVNDGYVFLNSNSISNLISIIKMDLNGNFIKAIETNMKGKPNELLKLPNGNLITNYKSNIYEFDSNLNLIQENSIQQIQNINSIKNSLDGFAIASYFNNLPYIAFLNNNLNSSCDTMLNSFQSSPILFTQEFIYINKIDNIFSSIPTSYPIFSIKKPNISETCYIEKKVKLIQDTIICENEFTLQNISTDVFDSYIWSNGETNNSITVNQSGIYYLKGIYNCGLHESIDSVYIEMISPLNFNLGENVVFCEDSSYILKGPECVNCTYLWNTNETTQNIEINKNGIYSLSIKKNDLCISIDSIVVETEICDCKIFIPNAFSPNNDMLNDWFVPYYHCNFYEFNFQIFSRWGELIFESFDINNFWDGTYKGKKVQEGIYFYKLIYRSKISNKIGKQKILSNSINLVY